MTIEISDTALRKPGISCVYVRGDGSSAGLRELGCGCEMIAHFGLRIDRENVQNSRWYGSRTLPAVRRAGWYASGIPGSADFMKTVIDIMDNDVVEGAKEAFSALMLIRIGERCVYDN